MTDRPILFSAPMVRALIEGRKTQTRRLLTTGNTLFNGGPWSKEAKAQTWNWDKAWVDPGPSPAGNPGPYLKLPWLSGDADPWEETVHRIYPRVQPRDRLWVRETWAEVGGFDPGLVIYRADYPACVPTHFENVPPADDIDWRVSIHLKRERSRLTLNVNGVRVQRLQDISEDDAKAEGAPRMVMDDDGKFYESAKGSHRCGFAGIWAWLHGAVSWDTNPWVLAQSFTAERRNIDA